MKITIPISVFLSGFFYFYIMKIPNALQQKLLFRKEANALRKLPMPINGIDFSSNDYLGFAKNEKIFETTHQYLVENNIKVNGATGSRLISGNHNLYAIAEKNIAVFHESEAALIFNSGYDANVGFFSAVPQRNDVILYDELCHASIRDGIQMSHAKSYKFEHNDYEDLETKIAKLQTPNSEFQTIYIVTESVFSMDGDSPNIESLVQLSEKFKAFLVIDEAHALGVFGEKGEGVIQSQQFQNKVFARIMTFGKGLGCHGAAILGNADLIEYLVNFARSFIYTTGLSPQSVATILVAYQNLNQSVELQKLKENITFFNQQKQLLGIKPLFVYSKSAIHSAIIPGNNKVKKIASQLQEKGFEVKAILSPTVPEGQERLRFCLHSYNTEQEMKSVLDELSALIL